MIVQIDFNFTSTFRVALELNCNESIRLLLNKVFEINSKAYQEILMLDLNHFLKFSLPERIYPFFERDEKEMKMI
jgi:hypothetical protein